LNKSIFFIFSIETVETATGHSFHWYSQSDRRTLKISTSPSFGSNFWDARVCPLIVDTSHLQPQSDNLHNIHRKQNRVKQKDGIKLSCNSIENK
jgi:hypothetical protein